MSRSLLRRLLVLALLACGVAPLGAQEAPADLADFRTAATAQTAPAPKSPATALALPGYLGIHVTADAGRVKIDHVQPGSPADKAGLRPGDIVRQLDGRGVKTPAALREQLLAHGPGATVALLLEREQKAQPIKVTLTATSQPKSVEAARGGFGATRATLGITVEALKEGAGVRIGQIQPDSPAATAGLKVGDVLLTIDGKNVPPADRFREALADHKPGEFVRLILKRDGSELEVRATLASGGGPGKGFAKGGGGGGEPAVLPLWKKDVYRLAVIPIDFKDVKHNDKITPRHWETALFSQGGYYKSPTGQAAFGSLHDYFLEQSYGKFHLEGKVFAPVFVTKKAKRLDYAPGLGNGNKTELLSEALDLLLTRDGKDALKNFDGLCFVYAGSRVDTNRGSLYAPHRGSVMHKDKRWAYILGPEGGSSMESISVLAAEFGKLLGLPELFARPENAGSEGLGVWCLMSNGAGEKGRPAHLSAWCKEQLGWLQPVVLDPTVKQKLILAPVQQSPHECYKVLVRADGTEYLLLENRTARGFDADLPGQGLLIWRVVNGRPTLEEAHGISGPTGPRVLLDAVPYPSRHNNAFTPLTTPSSRSVSGGGLPVYLTNIRRLPDGRITFFVGYDYY
jgi:M6 family metalloprotease-like protein